MAFPDRLLVPGEQVLEHLHPHGVTLLPAVTAFLGTCAGAGALIAVLPRGDARVPLLVAVLAVAAVVLVRWVLRPVVVWSSTHYVVTSERVLVRTGVLRRVGRDIPLARIQDVLFERTLWDRIVGSGSLTIQSAGDAAPQRLVHVPRSDRVQQLLYLLVDHDDPVVPPR